MQNRKESKECFDNKCTYNKPHRHIHTANGSYVKYIIEKPKEAAKLKEYELQEDKIAW